MLFELIVKINVKSRRVSKTVLVTIKDIVISKSMAKQYIFNITLNEQDAIQVPCGDQQTNILKDDLILLATKMSSQNMTKFAEKYLDVTQNQFRYNYTLLKYWCENTGENAQQARKRFLRGNNEFHDFTKNMLVFI